MDARATARLPPGARGIIFQLCENLGVLPRRPIEQQMAELSEEDRKALAKLGVRVGVYSLYFPSMLKPVPIRLRAGLWMIARNRDTIPPLPIEGRTSMDLPQGAERDFYGAIGYLPLGNHAIRADMVERLAAMARAAVRESRENARRAQQEKQQKQPENEGRAGPSTGRSAADAAPATDEISEWAIVAAAFGERRAGADRTCRSRARRAASRSSNPPPVEALRAPSRAAVEEPRPEEAGRRAAPATETAYATEETPPPARQRRLKRRRRSRSGEATAEEAKPKSRRPKRGEAPSRRPAAAAAGLVPRHAADDVAGRLLGARDGRRAARPGLSRPSADRRDTGRCMPSRSSRASCASARSSASASACRSASVASSAAASGRSGRTNGNSSPTRRVATGRARTRDGADDGPPQAMAPAGRPRPDGRGPTARMAPQGRTATRRPPGPRPPRRDTGGPALRLYATTEKKGETVADSPFAKLLELKLGGKK